MENLSASDVALLNNGGEWGGNSFLWIFALLILANGGFGFGNRQGEFGQFATSASQSEILLGQKFDALSRQINQVGDGLCSSTYALNNSIKDGNYATQAAIKDCCCNTQSNIDSVRFDMANYHADTNAVVTAQTQKVLDAICQNKIESLQGQVNQLQLQNAMSGVVRYPNAWTYNAGASPFCNSGCNCAI